MAPERASITPCLGLANLCQSTPGVSNNSSSADERSHCCPVVTPGRFPVWATFFLTRWLRRVDLPTFGTPTHMARIGRFLSPLAASCANWSWRISLLLLVTSLLTLCCRESSAKNGCPFAVKYCFHSANRSGSAKSVLVMISKRGLSPAARATSGF